MIISAGYVTTVTVIAVIIRLAESSCCSLLQDLVIVVSDHLEGFLGPGV